MTEPMNTEPTDTVVLLRALAADKALTIGQAWNLLAEGADEIAALRAEVERLGNDLRQAHKDFGHELRDPNGTIWQHATALQARAESAERELAAVRRYQAANPLGGPASMFATAASRIEAGESVAEVIADYGLCQTESSQIKALVDIRYAVGDNGLRMQDELVEYIKGIVAERDELRADRDSWRSQAEDRAVDWDAMRAERDELRARIAAAPVAIMDTREGLGVCAPTEDDFPALYALQGKRVRLVVEGEG